MKILFLLLGSLSFSYCTLVVKPNYIDPEKDLSIQIKIGLIKIKDGKASIKEIGEVLSNTEIYRNRIDYKLTENNKRALSK